MFSRASSGAFRLLAPVVAPVILGCATPLQPPPDSSSDQAVAPVPSLTTETSIGGGGLGSQAGLYPLQLGNRWLHRKWLAVALVPNSPGDTPTPSVVNATVERELVCRERLDGHDYLVERAEETPEGEGISILWWVRFRQDRTGLYEADVATSGPPACEAPPTLAPAGDATPSAGPGLAAADLARRMDALIAARSPATQSAYRAAWDRVRGGLRCWIRSCA